MKPFKQAVACAKTQEAKVAKFLSEHFECYVHPELNSNPYFDGTIFLDLAPTDRGGNTWDEAVLNDHAFNMSTATYELKDERAYSSKTGNHFVEIESRKKSTGICHTKADYWIVQPDNFKLLMIPSKDLVKGIVQNKWREVRGGDVEDGVQTSIGILVPLQWIEDNGKVLTRGQNIPLFDDKVPKV